MKFREMYPDRVTLGEDGVYRWSFDVDLSSDHTIRNTIMKVMLIVFGIICGLMALLIVFEGAPSMAWIPAACCGSAFLIALVSYRVYRAAVHDTCTVAYEMNGESITLVRNPTTQQHMNQAAIAMSVAGMVTGRGIGTGVAMAGAAQSGTTRFNSVRKLRRYPERHMIQLNALFSSNQVWVPAEDYEMVYSYLKKHTAAAIRRNRDVRWPQHLAVSAALSLGINGAIAAYNAASFRSTHRLPISLTTVSGDTVYQKAVGMSTMFLTEGATREQPWWMNRLETDSGSALAGFLLVGLVLFLVLTVIGLVRKGGAWPYEPGEEE